MALANVVVIIPVVMLLGVSGFRPHRHSRRGAGGGQLRGRRRPSRSGDSSGFVLS